MTILHGNDWNIVAEMLNVSRIVHVVLSVISLLAFEVTCFPFIISS
jgi:hypothetical protein